MIEEDRGQRGAADYLRVLERRRWVIVATAVLVTALTLVIALGERKVYSASTSVLLDRQDLASSVLGAPQNPALSEDPARYAADATSLARSSAVADLAISKAHVPNRTAGDLLAESSVTPSPNADVLDFTVRDTDPATAAALLNAYSAAFVAYRKHLETSALTTARAQLSSRLAQLRKSGGAGTAQYRALAATEQRLHTMSLLQSGDTVLDRPSSGSQIKPTPTKDALLGLGFGILLGIALAFVLDAIDKRIRSEDELESELELPLLARLPRGPGAGQGRAGLTVLSDPRGPHADGIRRLATRVVFASPDRTERSIMVTSAVEREGKSTTVANLGVALALAGYRVAVVELDLLRPSLASIFGVVGLSGVTEVVMGRAELSAALEHIPLPLRDGDPLRHPDDGLGSGSLVLLASGATPPSPGELVASDALVTRVLAPLRERFDYVIVDSPPMCVVGDASMLATRVDAVVVVTKPGVVDRGAIRDLARQLAATPARKLGFVVTDAEARTSYAYLDESSDRRTSPAPLSNGNGLAKRQRVKHE